MISVIPIQFGEKQKRISLFLEGWIKAKFSLDFFI